MKLDFPFRRRTNEGWLSVWLGEGKARFAHVKPGTRPAVVSLEEREWDATDGSGKRQAVQIIADTIQFLGSRGDGDGGNQFVPAGAAQQESADFPAAADDDIPF